jgi:hypothetical protein
MINVRQQMNNWTVTAACATSELLVLHSPHFTYLLSPLAQTKVTTK